jgi:hypothetical protein
MTQDEIIEMARQVGLDYLQYLSPEAFEKVVAFAKLIAQREREACAKLAQDDSDWYGDVATIADLIRARGQA